MFETEKSFWINPSNHGYLSITHIYLNLRRALQSHSAHSISADLLSPIPTPVPFFLSSGH